MIDKLVSSYNCIKINYVRHHSIISDLKSSNAKSILSKMQRLGDDRVDLKN